MKSPPSSLGPDALDANTSHTRWRKHPFIGALILGALASLLNLFPLHLDFPPHRVSINPGLALPIVAAVAWGWRYALVAALPATGALFTWWTWPQNGWANVAVTIYYCSWICWHGWCAERRRRVGRGRRYPWWCGLYAAEGLAAVVSIIFYFTLYQWAFALNPPFWKSNAVLAMNPEVLRLIVVKSVISNLAAVFVVDLLLSSHWVRRFLGLSSERFNRSATVVLSGSMVAALVVMIVESLLYWRHVADPGVSLIDAMFLDVETHRTMVRVLILTLCAFSGLVATRYLVGELTASQHLMEREEDLAITLDSIGDGVIATDQDGVITRLNPVAESLTGWPRSEAVGQPLERVFHIINAQTRRRCENPAAKVLACGRVVGLANHTMLIAKDGRERQIADSAAPIRDVEGAVRGVVLVFRDVTDAYRIEERLRQAEKMESLGLLAGGVAHDFNNMLGGIMGYAELVASQLGADHSARRHLTGIIHASERAADLTTKLLAFSRKGRTASEVFDAHHCLTDALDLLEPILNRQIIVRRYFMASRVQISADRSRLQNAMLNLGVNARDAMPEGGSITVTTDTVELSEDDSRLRQQSLEPGAYLSIVVEDTGCGMGGEVLERVFEPFYTTKGVGHGTGLGLAAVYGTITDCQGVVTISSTLGRGTSVSILLPLVADGPERDASDIAEAVGGGGVVLLAEDDDSLRDIACRHLTALGYEVLVAEHGAQAVDIFQEQAGRIDVVILDMVMPRMNGHEAFTRIRAIDPQARVLLCSGYTAGADIDALLDLGLRGFVAKPYRRTQLARAVLEALR